MARKLVVEIVGDATAFERSLRGASRATNTFSRDFSKAERGVLAGSGVFRGLGRSLAFASGGFLAFGGGAAIVRKVIDAAQEAQVVNRQLATQLKADGKDIADWREQIDKAATSLSALSGFQDDEIKAGLTTILRTVPDVSKALKDEALAADLARARHISLAQASTIVAKTEAGNTTLLRRQGFQIAKNATVEQALATVRAKVAGQARAGTTDGERFAAMLHQTEEIIGTALLPTLNKYLRSGTAWLEQMNESGQLERDVSHAAHELATGIDDAAKVIKTIDSVTGGFKNTLELLLALKVASTISRWSGGFTSLIGRGGAGGTGLRGASAESSILKSNLGQLARTGAIAIGIDMIFTAKGDVGIAQRVFGGALIGGSVGGVPGALIGGTAGGIGPFARKAIVDASTTAAGDSLPIFKNGKWVDPVSGVPEANQAFWNGEFRKTHPKNAKPRNGQNPYDTTSISATVGLGPHSAALIPKQIAADAAAASKSTRTGGFTAQSNQFFDNAIARILLRGGLGSIQQQIDALVKADELIRKRMEKTKDVTRRLHLEDELLQNQAQIRSLKAEQAATQQQAAADAHQKLVDAIAARAAARQASQFKALGLTAEGDQPVPGVKALRRALGNVSDQIQGTFLDTTKTKSLLARIRKVLSGGLGAVGSDVRQKIQEILGDLNRQLDQTTQTNLTKWKHLSTAAFLAGIPDLTAAQKRLLADKLATVSPQGTVPAKQTAAYALAGGTTTVVVPAGDVYMDGEKVGRITKSAQIKRGKKRTVPRAG